MNATWFALTYGPIFALLLYAYARATMRNMRR